MCVCTEMLTKRKMEGEAADFQGCTDMPQCMAPVRSVQQSSVTQLRNRVPEIFLFLAL